MENLIEILKVILLGIVEGITEWLPISSTGHMIIIDEFVQLDVTPEFKEMFFVVIQLGAIMAVVVLYWHKLWPFVSGKNNDNVKYAPKYHGTNGFVNFLNKYVKWDTMQMWFKVLVAALPAAIIGLPFDDKLDELFYNFQTVSITLIVYGIIFIIVENRNKNRKPVVRNFEGLTYKHAVIIGIFQILALIPGTSRSGATIIGAILIGTSRYVAAEFSFFLAIPIMFGASLLKLVKFGFAFQANELVLLIIGMVTAFIVSVIAIKTFMSYIKKKDFKVFGYYRIVLGIILIAYALLTA